MFSHFFQRALKLDLQDHAALRLCHMFAAIKCALLLLVAPSPPVQHLSLTLAISSLFANTVSPVSYRIPIRFITPRRSAPDGISSRFYLRLWWIALPFLVDIQIRVSRFKDARHEGFGGRWVATLRCVVSRIRPRSFIAAFTGAYPTPAQLHRNSLPPSTSKATIRRCLPSSSARNSPR